MTTLVTSGPGTRHEKESLNDYVARIDPAECPFYSNLSTKTVKAVKHEWTVQELTSASASNFAAEGVDSADSNGVVPVRLDNAVSLSTKDGKVSGTYDRIDTAGGQKETARQKMLKALELRRDSEAILTANNPKVQSGTRELGGAPTYITNGSLGATTGAFSSGTGASALVAGTDRAFITIDFVDDSMQAAFEDGGNPRAMYMTPGLKKRFSKIPDAIAGGATASQNEINQTPDSPLVFIGAASAYLSDFGRLEVIPSRHMIAKMVLGIDPDHAAKCFTPGGQMKAHDLAKVGDSSRFQIINEMTLEFDAPKAHFAITALDPALDS
jgi:hypothetical protein